MFNEKDLKAFQWFQSLPNETLQKYNTEINKILLSRYKEQSDEQQKYSTDLAATLCMLGERQTKENIQFIIDKLEKRNRQTLGFDKLINKLKGKLR